MENISFKNSFRKIVVNSLLHKLLSFPIYPGSTQSYFAINVNSDAISSAINVSINTS